MDTAFMAARRIYEEWFCGCTPRMVARESAGRFTHIADEGEKSPLVQQCYGVLAMRHAASERDRSHATQ